MGKYIKKLKENNLKITPKRCAIIDLLHKSGEALSPGDIKKKLSKKFKKVSYPSVYRNLEEMQKIGILARISKPDRRLYYALCRAEDGVHHHHIICAKCGKVGEIEECDLFKKQLVNGYKITSHFLQLEGVCPECRK